MQKLKIENRLLTMEATMCVTTVIDSDLMSLCHRDNFSRYIMGYISLIESFFKLVELVKLWPQIGPNSVICAPWHPLLRAAA